MKLEQISDYPPASLPPSPGRMLQDLKRENARLRRAVAELETYRNLACRDALTGLGNRRYFEERLSQEMSLCRRKPGRRFSLMLLDLNDLKRINDEDGHAAGDEAIKRAATFLRNSLREHDVVCRLGGDEFAVILRELGPAECAQLLTRLRADLATANSRRSAHPPIALSMGTASFPDNASDTRALYLRSDEAMYADKRRTKAAARATASAATASDRATR
jgi:diguanylate cyclase (GGDEF)-like protein